MLSIFSIVCVCVCVCRGSSDSLYDSAGVRETIVGKIEHPRGARCLRHCRNGIGRHAALASCRNRPNSSEQRRSDRPPDRAAVRASAQRLTTPRDNASFLKAPSRGRKPTPFIRRLFLTITVTNPNPAVINNKYRSKKRLSDKYRKFFLFISKYI